MANVIATIPVGSLPFDIKVSPDGTYAYVVNIGASTVSVIDTLTNTVAGTISTGTTEQGRNCLAFTPDGRHAYVVGDGDILVIDTATHTVATTISVAGFSGTDQPNFVVVSPDGARAYITNFDHEMRVVDTATNTVIDTIDVGQGAAFIAVTPDSVRVYVINSGDSTVSVIDAATDTIIDTIAIGAGPGVAGPGALVFSPDGTSAYLSYGARDQVTRPPLGVVLVIDTATNAITRTINVGAYGWLVISPDGSQLYATDLDDNTLSIVDTSTNAVTATVAVGDTPSGLAVNPQGTNVYVANYNSNSVSVISVQTAPPDSWHIPDLVGDLLGAVDRDGFGWVVIGNHFIPIPPRSPSMSAIARAAGPYMNQSVENRDIGEHIHKLR